jgi:hypothetical protein
MATRMIVFFSGLAIGLVALILLVAKIETIMPARVRNGNSYRMAVLCAGLVIEIACVYVGWVVIFGGGM